MQPSSSDLYSQRFALQRDLVTVHQLAATPCFDFTIDADFAVLNEQLRLAARVDEILPLHERVELDVVLFSHFPSWSPLDRQTHDHGRAAARLAARLDHSAVRLHNALRDRQP